MQDHHAHFADPGAIASYASATLRRVPGLADLHRMAALLLAERAPPAAQVLVVGAGGGLELVALAAHQPGWHFTGVDPSAAMLGLAREASTAFAHRVALVEGTVDAAPAGPYDGATCLLTLHFLDRIERLHTLREIHRRLTPGARLVVAHHAPPQPDRAGWLMRSAAFAASTDTERANAVAAGQGMAQRLPLHSPADEEAMLRNAGFTDVELFYAALSFRGWVATAS